MMKTLGKRTTAILTIFSLVLSVSTLSHSATIHVPADYTSIQSAIDDANDGDEIILQPGTYEGQGNYDIEFKGKAITVRSIDPNDPDIVDSTVIDGSSTRKDVVPSGFIFHSSEEPNSMLLGVSITGFVKEAGVRIVRARPMIRNCRIYGNKYGILGGFSPSDSIDALISDCVVFSNRVLGIYISYPDVKINNCIIKYNVSGIRLRSDRLGGDGKLIIKNCKIIGNYGNGIKSSRYLTVEDTIISRNGYHFGGTAIIYYYPIILKNCTITENYTGEYSVISCNSYANNADANIENCIIWGNYPNSTIQFLGPNSNYINYCNIEGGVNSIVLDEGVILDWGNDNIDVDPCFVEPGGNDWWIDGDYHLLPESLCIDAGDPNYIAEPNETDFDGNARIFNGRIDMGAYEFLTPIDARLQIFPRQINRHSRNKTILAWLLLPEDITKDQIDCNEPLLLYPGEIEATKQFVFQNRRHSGVNILAFFDKAELLEAIPDNSKVELEVTGFLKTGQLFYGTDEVWIKQRQWRRWHRR